MRRVLVVVSLVGVVALTSCGRATRADGTDPSLGTVLAVVDGDTVDIRLEHGTERVRLIGVDTPETKDADSPVECYGPEATAFTSRLIPPGTAVRLVRDVVPRDDYGRLLAYVVRVDDGLFVNEALLRHGYARPLTIAPNDTLRPLLAAAGSAGRSSQAGLWSHCYPAP